jgi:hypothetical protein
VALLRVLRLVFLPATSALLAACPATTPAPPPVLSLDGRSCHAGADLSRAYVLSLDTEKETTVTVDSDRDCLSHANGTKSTYVAFRLPAGAEPYIVSVASLPRGNALLSPFLMLLDEKGVPLRELPSETFLFRGQGFAANFRARDNEYFLVIASDPAAVGQTTSRIVGATQGTTASTGTAFFMIYTGSESKSTLTHAHSGTLNVSVRPVPKTN